MFVIICGGGMNRLGKYRKRGLLKGLQQFLSRHFTICRHRKPCLNLGDTMLVILNFGGRWVACGSECTCLANSF